MNGVQIKHMVSRFLGWTLPETFSPDAGISFKRTPNQHHHPEAPPFFPMPSGTNLFDAGQAEAMVRHMADGMPSPDVAGERVDAAVDTHYLRAVKVRLQSLYETTLATNVREQISDEVDWIDEKLAALGTQ